MELSAGKCGLDEVGGIGGPFGSTCAHYCVKLIYEEYDLPFASGYLVYNGLKPFLELAAELGSGHKSSDIKGKKALVLEGIGDVSAHDPLRKSFDDGGLSDTGLAYQHGIVLGLPRKHLHHTSDLLVTSDDGIHLALSCQSSHVAAVLLQGLILALGILVRHPLTASDALQRLHQCIARDSVALEKTADLSVVTQHCQDDMLGGDILVLELVGLRLCLRQNLIETAREPHVHGRAVCLGESVHEGTGLVQKTLEIYSDLCKERLRYSVLLLKHGQKHVLVAYLCVIVPCGKVFGSLKSLLHFYGKLINVHLSPLR